LAYVPEKPTRKANGPVKTSGIARRLHRRYMDLRYGTAIVLYYHRIIDDDVLDPEHLGITSSLFEEHVAMIAESFATPTLPSVCASLQARKRIPQSSVCITFDDGYRDNFEKALPILEQYRMPVTVFVSTLPWEGQLFDWDKGIYTDADIPTLYADAKLLRQVADHPLVTIGAHTHSHKRLSELAVSEVHEDIQRNIDLLTEACGQAPRLFAYPFGSPESFTDETVNAVRSFDFDSAFTTTYGTIHVKRDLAQLMRYSPHAMDAAKLRTNLQSWFGEN